MAINKKLIHFKNYADFNSKKLSANENNTSYTLGVSGSVTSGTPEILYQSICWIKDSKMMWTHGTLYDCSTVDLSEYYTKTEIDDQDFAKIQDLTGKQDALVSGESIKTINGESILGSGDIAIEMPDEVTESTVSGWGFAKSSELQTKANDNAVVHKTGNETITGAKTFNSGVNFLGSGDSNAVTLSTNTRINVNGTNQTVLGFGNGTFYINHGNYNLLLRGKATRPTYNSSELALSSDVNNKQDKLVSGTNIKTINNQSILGSGNITIEGGSSLTESDIAAMGFTKNTGTYSKPSSGIPKTDLASSVQTSLGKADTALQSIPEGYATIADVNRISFQQIYQGIGSINGQKLWVDPQVGGELPSFNFKTINGISILGEGDITISGGSDANVQAVDTGDVVDDVNVEYATKSYVDDKVANISLTDYATTVYVDGLVGDINSVLESIING